MHEHARYTRHATVSPQFGFGFWPRNCGGSALNTSVSPGTNSCPQIALVRMSCPSIRAVNLKFADAGPDCSPESPRRTLLRS
eukprot:5514927-Prymnesium_polylepis.1